MPSPFPGMDPYVEANPLFHELHTQMLAAAQARLQPQLRPKYVARLERALSEGSVWDLEVGIASLKGKEPDLTVLSSSRAKHFEGSTTVLANPTASLAEQLQPAELELRKQRRIVIYVQARPRRAVATIELLSPTNKEPGTLGQARYLEKRASALHGGLHWVEIDLLRGGQRPPMPLGIPEPADYLAYVAQATPTGWNHWLYTWRLRDPFPPVPIPLLGADQAVLDLGSCFAEAYDRTAADDEVDYTVEPPPPPLRAEDRDWADAVLRQAGLRG
jgi:hypothetical protein